MIINSRDRLRVLYYCNALNVAATTISVNKCQSRLKGGRRDSRPRVMRQPEARVFLGAASGALSEMRRTHTHKNVASIILAR